MLTTNKMEAQRTTTIANLSTAKRFIATYPNLPKVKNWKRTFTRTLYKFLEEQGVKTPKGISSADTARYLALLPGLVKDITRKRTRLNYAIKNKSVNDQKKAAKKVISDQKKADRKVILEENKFERARVLSLKKIGRIIAKQDKVKGQADVERFVKKDAFLSEDLSTAEIKAIVDLSFSEVETQTLRMGLNSSRVIGVRLTIDWKEVTVKSDEDDVFGQTNIMVKTTGDSYTKDIMREIRIFKGRGYKRITGLVIKFAENFSSVNRMNVPLFDYTAPALMTFDNKGEVISKVIGCQTQTCMIDLLYEYVLKYSKNISAGLTGNGNFPYMSRDTIASKLKAIYISNSDQDDELLHSCHHPMSVAYEELSESIADTRNSYDPFVDGVSVTTMAQFCKDYRISFHCLTIDNSEFYADVPVNRRAIDGLMIVVENSHAYKISSKEIRLKIRNSSVGRTLNKRHSDGSVSKKKYKSKDEVVDPDYVLLEKDVKFDRIGELKDTVSETVFVCQSSNDHILFEFFGDRVYNHNEFYTPKFVSNRMSAVQLNNSNTLMNNSSFEMVKFVCDQTGIKFTNQSISLVSKLVFDKVTSKGLTNLASSFNSDTLETLKGYLPRAAWVTTYEPIDVTTKNLVTYDINKCYSNVLLHSMESVIVFDIRSDMCKFDGILRDDSLYYVKTDCNVLFSGNGFYYPFLVRQGLMDNLISESDITSQIQGKLVSTNGVFKTFVEYVNNILVSDDKKLSRTPKDIVNMFIGLMGKILTTVGKTSITTSLKSACSSFFEKDHTACVYANTINEKLDQHLYTIDDTKQVELEQHHFTVFAQVIQSAKLQVYDLVKLAGGKLMEVRTDSVCVQNSDNVVPLSTFIGGYKTEPVKTHSRKATVFTQKDDFVLVDHKEIEPIIVTGEEEMDTDFMIQALLNKSVLIEGIAGTGKSVITKSLCEWYRNAGKKVVMCAPTHLAARNLHSDATSCHRTFGFDIQGKIHTTKFDKIDVLVIDEISMLNTLFWKEIIRLRRRYPKMLFVLVGDFNQLPPIGEETVDFRESNFLKDIVDYSLEIKVLKRCDEGSKIQFQLLHDLIGDRSTDYHRFESSTTLLDKNLCFTNACSNDINNQCMIKNRGSEYLTIDPDGKPDTLPVYVQTMYIYPGLPLRCKKAICELVNGDQLVVDSYSETHIVLRSMVDESLLSFPIDNSFVYNFVASYCTTIHSAQGQSFDSPYTIYEIERLSKKLKYVAISRARKLSYIHIE